MRECSYCVLAWHALRTCDETLWPGMYVLFSCVAICDVCPPGFHADTSGVDVLSSPLLVRLSVLPAQLSGVRPFFLKIKIQCTQSEFGARSPHSSRGDREKGQKKSGQWRHLSTAIAAVPGTEKAKKN